MSLPDVRKPFRLTGWHVLGLFVAFFGVTLGVDTLMIVDAYRSYPGETTDQPYEEGLRWDQELDQQAAQRALGWSMSAGFDARGDIQLTARDRGGAPVVFPRIDARIDRPATEQGERALHFTMARPGVYVAQARGLSGAWDLHISAYDGRGRRFDAEKRLTAP